MNIKTTGNIIGYLPMCIFALFASYSGAKQSVVETQFLRPSNQETLDIKTLDQSLTEDTKLLIETPSTKWQMRPVSELEGLT